MLCKLRLSATVIQCLDALPHLVWIADNQGRSFHVNNRYRKYTGLSKEQLPESYSPPAVHPDDQQRLEEEYDQCRKARQPLETQGRLRRADGAYRWHLICATPECDPAGAVQNWLGTCTDIHETRQRLDEQARLATLRSRVADAFHEMAEFGTLLTRYTEEIVTGLDAAFARIWLLDETRQILELRASSGMYRHIDGGHARVRVGEFKIGLIASENKPHLTNSVIGDPRVHDQAWAKREGMVAFAGYPLVSDGRVCGVVAVFARHPLSDAAFETLGWVADGIARGIERKAFENKLAAQNEAMSTPVLEVRPRLLIVPLIGVLDVARARRLTDELLRNIRERRGKAVVIDVTGVQSVDRSVAHYLHRIAEASRLLGARLIVTGISKAIAQTFVELNVDLGALSTAGGLQNGIEEAMAWLSRGSPISQRLVA